ncbi:MAG: FecR domain-containing protein [Verrucomicrobiota bacterium]
MSDRPSTHAELLLLCGKVRDDALTAEDAARLDALLRSSDEAKALYVQYMSVLSLLESRGVGQHAGKRDSRAVEEDDQNLLFELLALEQAAETQVVEQPKAVHLKAEAEPTSLQVGGALRYLVEKPAVWGSIAAVLAIALVLTLVFSWDNGTPAPIADQPSNPGRVVAAPIVAALTAERGAVWSTYSTEGALAPGSPLRAGQRLALKQGFAQVTTEEGTVVILEAPTTIELINTNAIELHSGKLVGICSVPSSKGFVVRTRQAEITDIGTRFGVVQDGVTKTWVIEGQVSVSSKQSSAPTLLETGTGAIVDQQASSVEVVSSTEEHYFDKWDTVVHLPRLEGEVRFEPLMPASLYFGEFEREWISLFREQSGVRLSSDLAVTVDGPGEHYALGTLESTLAAGTRVDSYLLHLDLPGEVKANSQRSATIQFDRPILAVVSRSTQLADCDAALGNPGVRYIKGNATENKHGGVRGMEPATSKLEAIKISEDRRTLTVDMILVGSSIDQARVVLEAKETTN